MKTEIEDIIFLILVIGIFGIFLYISNTLASSILSIAFLWISLSVLIIIHTSIYIKKKRDMRIEKMRYLCSIFPFYLITIYLTYQENINHIRSIYENILILGLILLIFIITAAIENYLKR